MIFSLHANITFSAESTYEAMLMLADHFYESAEHYDDHGEATSSMQFLKGKIMLHSLDASESAREH